MRNNIFASIVFIFISTITAIADDLSRLTAKIEFPYENALVRADVPIYGFAYGKLFKKYRLEYGKGKSPNKWILFTENNKPVTEGVKGYKFTPGIGPIKGNLGTWETGLDSYCYKDYDKDLSGIYTVRLVVEDTGDNTVEDRVSVEVGEVATNIFGGTITSVDGDVVIDVPEHALYETAVVMSVNPVDRSKIKLIVDPPYKLNGKIYEIKPSEWRFARNIKIKMRPEDKEEGLCIYEYDLVKCRWMPLVTEVSDNWLTSEISQLASGRSYYAILHNPSPVEKKQNPQTERNRWKVYSGVMIEYDEKGGRNGGRCLKFINASNPGYFASVIRDDKFNAEEYPIVEFNYKIPSDLKINFLFKVNGRWYEAVFTDTPKSYLRINMKKIGDIPNVISDNRWHTARFNVYNMLANQTKSFEVERIIMADFDSFGYMELTAGHNKQGATYYIDNFRIRKPYPNELIDTVSVWQGKGWQLGVDDGSPDEFSYERYEGRYKDSDTDDDFYIGDPFGELERAVAFDDRETNIFFNLNKKDLAETYLLYIDACNCDLRNIPYVEFGVWLNDKLLEKFDCIYEKGDIFSIPIKKGLKEGQNKITIKWLGGGNWIAWDYIKFAPINEK